MRAGWQTKSFGEILKKTETTNPLQSPESEFEYIDVSSVSNSTFQIEETQSLKGKDAPSRARKLVKANDILFATIRPTLRRIAVVPEQLDNQVCSTGYFVLRPQEGIDYRFVFYWLFTEDFMGRMEQLQKGASYPAVTDAEVRAQVIPFPPLPEQHRIVNILDESFDGIATAKANAEKNLKNAKALFESHLQSVFTQRGEGWEEELVGSVCDVKHGFAFDGAEFSSDVPAGNPIVITPGNFTEDGKLLFNEKNTKRFSGVTPVGYRFEVGDLVVVMTDLSSKMKILGKPAFVETNDLLHNQRIGRVVFLNNRIEKRFLYYYMMGEQFLKSIKASATGTMVKHTAPKRILNNLIPFPPSRKEQQAIVAKLDSLRKDTQHLESIYQQKLTALDDLKKSLLHQAFSGEL